MIRFLFFALLTTMAVVGIYQSHYLASYVYFNYCNGLALGSPVCLFVLDFIRLGAQSVNNFWVYFATVISGFILYAFNRLFSEISGIHKQMNINENDIRRFRQPVSE